MRKLKKNSTLNSLRNLWKHISNRRRRHLIILLIGMFFGGILEVVSISSIVPFLGALLSPETLVEYKMLHFLFDLFMISSRNEMIVFVTVLFLSAVIFSALFRGVLFWINIRLSHAVGGELELEVYRRTIYQSYEVQKQHNSTTAIAGITKASSVTTIIFECINIIQSIILFIFIAGIILFIDLRISLTTVFAIGIIYLVIMFFAKSKLLKNGLIISKNINLQLKLIQESLGGIREILLEGRQKQFCSYFNNVTYQLKYSGGTNSLIRQSPRMLIEPLAILLIGIVSCYISLNGDFHSKMPILAAIAFAAQRILPAAQQIYGSWSVINSNISILDNVLSIINQVIKKEFLLEKLEPINFKNQLDFKNVSFQYEARKENILDNLSISIRKGDCIGITGKTGSGKSTLLDLVLGLLPPTKGSIYVDNEPMMGVLLQKWQRSIAHVPQDIYLADVSIAENIAFGDAFDEINFDLVQKVIGITQLTAFIDSQPLGLKTIVGERGKQLSGGQRQRLGLARALYRQVPVLVLDEATSALDIETEKEIIKKILSPENNRTLILVTHRSPSLKYCDVIFEIAKGNISQVK